MPKGKTMASTLTYYNHNHNHYQRPHHNPLRHNNNNTTSNTVSNAGGSCNISNSNLQSHHGSPAPFFISSSSSLSSASAPTNTTTSSSTTTTTTASASTSASSSSSSSSSTTTPTITAAPYVTPLPPTSQPLPVAGAGAGAALTAAAAAAAAAAAIDSSPAQSHPSPSLSSWAEWPAEQRQHRRLGSDTSAGSGIGAAPGPGSGITGAGRKSTSACRPGSTTARSRRVAAPRHHRQRRSSSSRHMYRPTTTTTITTSSAPSACPPSLVRSSSSSSSSTSRSSNGSLSPGAATLTSAPTMADSAAAPGRGATGSASSSSSNNTMSSAGPRPSNKRSTDGPIHEDPSSNQAAAGKLKLPRLERGSDDFSSVVKNRLQSYTRTGQACDRCKVRKIRCDALPEGCSHCINLNLECYVTDRVTGRTERRGYMQQLEREKSGMLSYIRDLEKLLGENGIEVKPFKGPASAMQQFTDDSGSVNHPTNSSSPTVADWPQSGTAWMKSKSSASNSPSATTSVSLRPKLLAAQTDTDEPSQADGHESVALKSIKGTRLTLLDMTIDTAAFHAPEMEEPPDKSTPVVPLYRRSVQAFIQSSFKMNPVVQPDMPSRHDAFTFCNWYFLVFSPFFPLLHKPTFLQMLTRMYDEPGFEPSAPELLTLHVVFAMLYHNYGARNWQLEGRIHYTALADKHYHFALSKLHEVLRDRTLAAAQGLTLLAIYMRSFPKPGCAPLVLDIALQKALELGLHCKEPSDGNGTNLNREMRKRTWWSLLSLAVFTCGRLGRPMPMTAEQFDTEVPEPIADEHISEDGVDPNQTVACPFEIGIALHKLTEIALDMYTHVHSVRCDRQQYPYIVEILDRRIQEWEDSLPDSLRLDRPQQPDTVLHAYYTKMYLLEVRFCLRHPSVAPKSEKELRDENVRITESVAHEMLAVCQEVLKYRAIDTTWYHISFMVACIFSTLASHWERRYEISPHQMALLQEEMARWLGVFKDMSILMGGGPGLLIDVTRIVDRTVAWIEQDMHGVDAQKPRTSSTDAFVQGGPLAHPGYSHAQTTAAVSATPVPPPNVPEVKAFFPKPDIASPSPFTSFSCGEQPPASSAPAGYETQHPLFYNNASAQGAVAGIVSLAPGDPSVEVNPLVSFASQATQHVGPASQPDMMWQNQGSAWSDWENSVADSQDRYSASTLLTLGAVTRATVPSQESSNMTQAAADLSFIPNSQWPLNLFDTGAEGGTGGGV